MSDHKKHKFRLTARPDTTIFIVGGTSPCAKKPDGVIVQIAVRGAAIVDLRPEQSLPAKEDPQRLPAPGVLHFLSWGAPSAVSSFVRQDGLETVDQFSSPDFQAPAAP